MLPPVVLPLKTPVSRRELLSFRRLLNYPRDPPVLKILRRVNFGTKKKFGTDDAKRYGEGSDMLVFLGRKGRKTVQTVKNYGGSKMLRIRAPYYIFSTEGSFGLSDTLRESPSGLKGPKDSSGWSGFSQVARNNLYFGSPQMWVWPELVFGGSPPHIPHCNWRTLPSSQTPSLPALSFPLPPTPLALFARLWEGGAAQAGGGEGSKGGREWGGWGASKRHLGPDPHLGVLDYTPPGGKIPSYSK